MMMASRNTMPRTTALSPNFKRIIRWTLTLFGVTWCTVLWYAHSSLTSSLLRPQTTSSGIGPQIIISSGQQQLEIPKPLSPLLLQSKTRENPFYGWQPHIANAMECSWRDCFSSGHQKCRTCRDDPDDLGPVPPVVEDWVPDVTMLHRMMLEGKDNQGKPWPPPLDPELCEPMGVFGGKNDENQELLDAVPIVAQPMKERTLSTTKKGPKILCMVYTMEDAHATTIRAIRETWAGGCDGFLAFSTVSDPRIPAISLEHLGHESYDNMWQKVRSIWKFVATHYLDEFDWFFQGGDDLFVIPQNLRSYLDTLGSPEQDYFVGRRFKAAGPNNYFNSGGAGYALSRGTLRKYRDIGWNHTLCSPKQTTSMEDVMIAQCLRRVFQIDLTDTRDSEGRERFHPFAPGSHYHWKPPVPPKTDWYDAYNQEWGLLLGKECCAPDSVSFHYIKKPAMVRHIHSLLNHCKN